MVSTKEGQGGIVPEEGHCKDWEVPFAFAPGSRAQPIIFVLRLFLIRILAPDVKWRAGGWGGMQRTTC